MNNTNFPYVIKELETEERLKILKACNVSEMIPPFDFMRVGPKNYKQLRPYCEEAADIYNMEIRSTDRFVITYPRSGTTMTQELVWLIENNFDYETAKSTPLFKRFPYIELLKYMGTKWQDELLENTNNKEEVLELMGLINMPAAEKLSAMPSPRYLKTHMALSLLPPTLLDTAKVVYVARDPRDVAVSYFHLHKLIHCSYYPGTFKDFWNLFIQDLVRLTPLFEHVKEAWNLRNHPNLLFLFYENYQKDASASIRQIANFLSKEVTTEQVNQLCDHLNFKTFKNNDAVNFENLKEMRVFDDKEYFIRRGKVGGWRDYFDEEMTQQAEQWIADNLRDTDLRFPHF